MPLENLREEYSGDDGSDRLMMRKAYAGLQLSRNNHPARVHTEILFVAVIYKAVTFGSGIAMCGGGTMPKAEIPSLTIDIAAETLALQKLASPLWARELSMIGYIAVDKYRLDLRTIMPEQDAAVIENLRVMLGA